ncbi:acyl-CoA N-acyltransferase [Aspergillus avenaceus]|uniref:Acyl-CoA N-acyltransferase n=1 Tax=Aspergillus avenaceus TaxID=36643 RepID=A0A5N6U6B1_ASPAV|nr:acyl-CoA N-acyltransferase [Aspergillus avenaceus]
MPALNCTHCAQCTLAIAEVTRDDVPKLSQVWYRAFGTPPNLVLFPDTPCVRTWWNETNLNDLCHRPYQRFLKVVSSTDPSSVLGYAKWDLEPDRCGERFPPWHAESDGEHCSEFFDGIEQQRKNIMAGRKHYYLDMLAVNPDYGRRGAGSKLVEWGCDLADQDGVPIYLASSDAGIRLYQKFGFEILKDRKDTPNGVHPMVREPKNFND